MAVSVFSPASADHVVYYWHDGGSRWDYETMAESGDGAIWLGGMSGYYETLVLQFNLGTAFKGADLSAVKLILNNAFDTYEAGSGTLASAILTSPQDPSPLVSAYTTSSGRTLHSEAGAGFNVNDLVSVGANLLANIQWAVNQAAFNGIVTVEIGAADGSSTGVYEFNGVVPSDIQIELEHTTSADVEQPGATLTASAVMASGAASGTATVSGGIVSAAAELIAGSASAQGNAQANGATFTAPVDIVTGNATGGATAYGDALAVNAALIEGDAQGQTYGTAPGALLTATAAPLAGQAQGGSTSTALGKVLPFSASLVAGTASGTQDSQQRGGGLSVTRYYYVRDEDEPRKKRKTVKRKVTRKIVQEALGDLPDFLAPLLTVEKAQDIAPEVVVMPRLPPKQQDARLIEVVERILLEEAQRLAAEDEEDIELLLMVA